MVTHHGEFKVAVTAVCRWETENTGGRWESRGGRKEGGNSGKTRKKEKQRKGRGGVENTKKSK